MKRMMLVFLAVLVLCFSANAQSGLVVTATSEAVAFNYNNTWSVGNHSVQSVDLINWGAQKGNSLSGEVHEFLAPTPNFNSYVVGAKFVPDLSSLLSKTNLSTDQFQVFVQAGGGETILPIIGAKSTIIGGGGASWAATPNLTVNIADGYWLHFNNTNSFAITGGLTYVFNPSSSLSLAVKRRLAIRALAKSCTVTK